MQKLHLPEYQFRTEEKAGKVMIFDDFRRRWVILTPEEWVRQHMLRYLVTEREFPLKLMAVEKRIRLNSLDQRFDLLVYDRLAKPLLIAEFKAPNVEITQSAFDQAVRYNTVLKAPFCLISNGLKHFICRIDFADRKTEYLSEIPLFKAMTEN